LDFLFGKIIKASMPQFFLRRHIEKLEYLIFVLKKSREYKEEMTNLSIENFT
jgi:hypothetical protein